MSGTDAPSSLWNFSIRRGSRKGLQQTGSPGPAKWSAAAAEFQKFLDHPAGIVQNVLLSSLAHFQLARAYALQGDTAKARTAYKDYANRFYSHPPVLKKPFPLRKREAGDPKRKGTPLATNRFLVFRYGDFHHLPESHRRRTKADVRDIEIAVWSKRHRRGQE